MRPPIELDLVELLEPAEMELAAAVVLSDGHLDLDGLARVVGTSPTASAGALDLLGRMGLVRRVPPDSVIVSHAYLRRWLLDRLDPDVRRRLHLALSEALDAAGASAALVSAHAEAAEDPGVAPRGIAAAAVACVDALRVGEIDAAISLLERIQRLAAGLPRSG